MHPLGNGEINTLLLDLHGMTYTVSFVISKLVGSTAFVKFIF